MGMMLKPVAIFAHTEDFTFAAYRWFMHAMVTIIIRTDNKVSYYI